MKNDTFTFYLLFTENCNLFIFHLPNSFTNRDLYHLFAPFGEIVSVRIITEKFTGRSRGIFISIYIQYIQYI